MTPHPYIASRIVAAAVGSGVAVALHEGPDVDTPEAWTHYCVKAAMEARAAVLDDPPLEAPTGGEGAAYGFIMGTLRDIGVEDDEDAGLEPMSGEALTVAANHAAAVAFRCCMPQVTSRRRAQAYIACVAVGVQHGFLSGAESRSLLYVAQLALSAHPKRAASPRHHRRNAQ